MANSFGALFCIFQFSRFTGKFSEVIQLRSADLALSHDFHPVDTGRMNGERTFDANAERYAADDERLAQIAVLTGDHGAFERLKTFSVSLDDLDVH